MKFLSDIGRPDETRGANLPLDQRSVRVMRRMESSERLTGKLLSSQVADNERGRGNADPLMRALIDRLPKPDAPWPLEDRAKWLRTAINLFDLVYKTMDGDQRELNVVMGKPEAQNSKEGISQPLSTS